DVSALIAQGAISFNTVSTNGGANNVLSWSYNPAAADLDWLRYGDSLTITYQAQVNDGHGNVGSEPITITINGASDYPVITAHTDPVNAVVEAINASPQQDFSVIGTLTVTDLDIGDD